MKKFKVTTDFGLAGTEDIEIVEAETEEEAFQNSWENMLSQLSCSVEEATEEDIEEYE